MIQYLDLLADVYYDGIETEGRNGLTKSLFGKQMTYSLRQGFPIITTKRMAFKSIVGELIGFIRGYTHVKDFQKLGCDVWNQNADFWSKDGYLGRIYGAQWREWKSYNPETNEIITTDQLINTVENIKSDPFSRRHVISAWNPGELDFMALPPCHTLMQFHVLRDEEDIATPKYLSLKLYQRSGDLFLGVPFNISSYCLLLSMVAQVTNLIPLHFIHTLGDAHLYEEHFDAAEEQLRNEPQQLPQLLLNPNIKDIAMFIPSDVKLKRYKSYPQIKAKMIV